MWAAASLHTFKNNIRCSSRSTVLAMDSEIGKFRGKWAANVLQLDAAHKVL